MKQEKKFIKEVLKIMKNSWEVQSLESPLTNKGIADYLFSVNGNHGIIEFKCLKKWPKREKTIIRVEHFTKEQKSFLYRHGKHGKGGCFLFLKIEDDVLIYDYKTIYEIGKLTKLEMFEKSCMNWHTRTIENPYLLQLNITRILTSL